MSIAGPCITCNTEFTGGYCPSCGERRIGKHDYALGHFLTHAIEAFTHLDTNIFRSLRTLISSPGQLTCDYLEGKRKYTMSPIQLFLVVNILYFILQPFTGWNTLTTNLDVHLHREMYSPIAREMVAKSLAASGLTESEYTREFDHITATHAKSLVIFMVPAFALLAYGLYGRVRRFYVEHLVFSLHFYAFWLLGLCLITGTSSLLLRTLRKWDITFSSEGIDSVVALVSVTMCVVYLALAGRKVYGGNKLAGVLKTIILVVTVIGVLRLYRFMLFFTTLWSM